MLLAIYERIMANVSENIDLTFVSNDLVIFIETFESTNHLKRNFTGGKKTAFALYGKGKILAICAGKDIFVLDSAVFWLIRLKLYRTCRIKKELETVRSEALL